MMGDADVSQWASYLESRREKGHKPLHVKKDSEEENPLLSERANSQAVEEVEV